MGEWLYLTEKEQGGVYFAALNTGQGFISYFREIFDPCENVYVIKGGSGIGKSRLMREVSSEGEKRGYEVCEFLCSSDPTSLDGVIIPELSVAVLDGTAPHVHEPTLIGVREKFIDLSAFLNGAFLKEKKPEIVSLIKAKGQRFSHIYDYLRVMGIYDEIVFSTVCKALCEEKMTKAVEKYALYPCASKRTGRYFERIRVRSAISSDGHIVLNTYAKNAQKRFSLTGSGRVCGLFLKKMLEKTRRENVSVYISYDPFCPDMPDALYYPESGVSFYSGVESDYEETVINISRFLSDEKLRPYKPELRSIERLRKAVNDQMLYDFSAVRRLHAELEEIYGAAMDFKEKEKLTERILKEIFE